MQRFRLIAIVFSLLAWGSFAAIAGSASPSLADLIKACQSSPDDAALREHVVKKTATSKPRPVVPEEARRALIQGNAAFSSAQSADDYDRAAQHFVDARNLAPWWGNAYFNLAKTREKQGKFGEAIANLKLFILSAPPAGEARSAQDHIYAMEDKAKAESDVAGRASAAAALLPQLVTGWGQQVIHVMKNCSVFTSADQSHFCDEADVAHGNWSLVDVTEDGSETWDSEGHRLQFDLTGAQHEIIRMQGAQRWNVYCGTVSNAAKGVAGIDWAVCFDPAKKEPATITFGTGNGGSPHVIVRTNCDASTGRCTTQGIWLQSGDGGSGSK